MMSKLTAQDSSLKRPINQKFIKVKGEDNLEIIMIKIDIKIHTVQTVEIGECHRETKLSIDRTIEEGCSTVKIIEVTLGEVISEECKL